MLILNVKVGRKRYVPFLQFIQNGL